jgi:hypothetical protein
MASNFIRRVLIATAAETTRPTAPAAGANISNVSGWFSLGSRARGDDGDLDGDRIDVPMFTEYGVIHPPVAMTPTDYVAMQNGPDAFDFVAYDCSKEVTELSSDMVYTGRLGTKTLNTVKRSLVIEVNGLYYLYFPNVELTVTTIGQGISTDGQSKTSFNAKPCAGLTLAAGFLKVDYEA